MTRLQKINTFRIERGLTVLKKLPNFFTSCEECGTASSKTSINGGRCECCGNMICTVSAEQVAAWENENE